MKTQLFLPLFLLIGNVCLAQTTTEDSTRVAENETTSETASITSTVSDPVSRNNDFKLYPNPAIDQFNIETKLLEFTLKIYNMKGDVIFEKKDQSQVDVSGFDKGIYFVTITDHEGRQLIKKLIVQ